MTTRRDFLRVLLASPVLAQAIAAEAGVDAPLTAEQVSYTTGEDTTRSVLWLRVTCILPDGEEWHTLTEAPLATASTSPSREELLRMMWRCHELVLERKLKNPEGIQL